MYICSHNLWTKDWTPLLTGVETGAEGWVICQGKHMNEGYRKQDSEAPNFSPLSESGRRPPLKWKQSLGRLWFTELVVQLLHVPQKTTKLLVCPSKSVLSSSTPLSLLKTAF